MKTIRTDAPHILLVNPWIHDFAAYDFWAKPMGLLSIAAILRQHGVTVSYVDCLDRFHPRAPAADPAARYGRGPYLKTPISRPSGLNDVPRRYSRYGIKPRWLEEDLAALKPPDLIFVTSLMTYWYPGLRETIAVLRSVFGRTPIVLGGIYARLCTGHARRSAGADYVSSAPAEKNLFSLVNQFTGFCVTPAFDSRDLDSYPYPALDLQTRINYVPLLTSRGCPFRCAYCASHRLEPERLLRSPESVITEILYWHQKHAVVDFVLYDDAFLVDADHHANPILEKILQSGIRMRFHTPNAVHIRGISARTARLMFQCGFKTLRLGLETADFDQRGNLDHKVCQHEFEQAIKFLKTAGFTPGQVGAYLLAGLPGQSWASIEQSIRTVKCCGITPIIAHYTPIPGTALWPRAVAASRYDLEADPVFTNNAVMPCSKKPFTWQTISRLKQLAAE